MTRILILYYSQSGEAALVTEALAASLHAPDLQVVVDRLRPRVDYPFPWRGVRRFFDVLPECQLGPVPELEPPGFDPDQRFDLVILVYQVWFLAPSLPIQGFLRSPAARVLRDTKVMTVSVSRNMWQSASETMKQLLREVGARHIDQVALTHQGPPWATFVTTPRSLLFGKKEAFWGIFPAAGIEPAELEGVQRFGQAIVRQRDQLHGSDDAPLLGGLGAVRVDERYVLPELVGWYWFRGWARVLRWLGRRSPLLRAAGIYLFVGGLVSAIVLGIPLILIVRLLLYPLVRRWTVPYVRRLAEPSGP